MTISIWRYSHLALAISSFVFIFLASVTGIILAVQPISEKLEPYKVDGFNTIQLAETIATFQDVYPEIISLEVDRNDFVTASVFTEDGASLEGYFNPKTGEYLGKKLETPRFFQWTTTLHRSLFMKGTGRFFVGLSSFLLFLIATSGLVLIIKRQRSFKKFFSRIVKEDFSQYWHVVLGRIFLIPIIIITLTGVFLSLDKFNLLPATTSQHEIDYEALEPTSQTALAEMAAFKNIPLSAVKSVEFPFSDDIEDFYTLNLKDRELVVNQFSGEILSSIEYPWVSFYSNWSMLLHTGRGSILWSVILGIASLNILFFIFSGFAMTLKRRSARLKNKFKKKEAKFVILVGSENGGTLVFANVLQQQLIAAGESVYIAELNKYNRYKKAEHLIIMTSTYGEGEAPTNANKFLDRLQDIRQKQAFNFSVIGFGSLAYADYCKFALEVNQALLNENANQFLPPFTINDKSLESFEQWVQLWSSKVGIPLSVPREVLNSRPKQVKAFEVISKTSPADNPDNTFILTLKPKFRAAFTSGDLLAIYPKDDYRERLYSIGKVNGNIQLSIKYYDRGLGSNYLNNLEVGAVCQARIIENAHFHLPKKAKELIIVSNGTGIAPFIGMLDENERKRKTQLYHGLRTPQSFDLYKPDLQRQLEEERLSAMQLAYSRQGECVYVQELLKRDGEQIAQSLENKCQIMICGSMSMYKEVMEALDIVCMECNKKPLSHYKKQIKSDCY